MSSSPTLWAHLAELTAKMKASTCTRESHEASKLTADWDSMEYVGIQEVDQDYSLELRNCKCGSTLAKRRVNERQI